MRAAVQKDQCPHENTIDDDLIRDLLILVS